MMVWNACIRAAELGSFPNSLQLYLTLDNYRVILEIFGSHEQKEAPQLRQTCCAVGCHVVEPEDVESVVGPLEAL